MRRRRLLLPLHTIRESTRNIFKFRSSINHKIVVKLFCPMARSVSLYILLWWCCIYSYFSHTHSVIDYHTNYDMKYFFFQFRALNFSLFPVAVSKCIKTRSGAFSSINLFYLVFSKNIQMKKTLIFVRISLYIRWYSAVGQARSRLVRFYLTCLEGGGREGEEERHIARLLHKWGLLETQAARPQAARSQAAGPQAARPQAAGPQAAGFSNLLTKVN